MHWHFVNFFILLCTSLYCMIFRIYQESFSSLTLSKKWVKILKGMLCVEENSIPRENGMAAEHLYEYYCWAFSVHHREWPSLSAFISFSNLYHMCSLKRHAHSLIVYKKLSLSLLLLLIIIIITRL